MGVPGRIRCPRRIRRAAELADESLSSFVLAAALDRAEGLQAEASTTVVSSDLFDVVNAALDELPRPKEVLSRVTRRSRPVKQK